MSKEGKDEAVELVRYMVQSILGNETKIELETEQNPGELCINVHVPSDVRGRIIGRHGRAARSMRNILSAGRFDVPGRLTLDIVD